MRAWRRLWNSCGVLYRVVAERRFPWSEGSVTYAVCLAAVGSPKYDANKLIVFNDDVL